MLRFVAVLSLLLGLPGCAISSAPAAAQWSDADLAGAKIELTRTICYGACPVYSVEIRGDGNVTFVGEKYVLVEGTHRYTVDPADVRKLFDRFRTARFWSLKDRYVADATDHPSKTITVTIGGESKSVHDYVGERVGMPAVVSELEDAVDGTADTARMVRGNERTLPTLRAGGWDFYGASAGGALERAAKDAPDAVVLGLIEGGANPNGDGDPDRGDDGRDYAATPLEIAAMMGRLEIVRRLVAAGATTNGPWIRAALRGAVVSGDPATVAEILKYGPDVNAPVSGSYTPVQWVRSGPQPRYDAPGFDQAGVIKLLVAAGARQPAE